MKTRHVEGPMFHTDVDVVGCGARHFLAVLVGQGEAGMASQVEDWLVLCE
jgi:hypothetical protein